MLYRQLIMIVPLLLGCLSPSFSSSRSTRISIEAPYQPGIILVKFDEGIPKDIPLSVSAQLGAEILESIPIIEVQAWMVPAGSEEEIIKSLLSLPGVLFAEPNYIYQATVIPDDTEYPRQWGLLKINAPAAWDISTGTSGVIVAVIDTGIDETHPDLKEKIIPGYDYVDNDTNPHDLNGHGTHVAGIAAAISNNAKGITGVNWQSRIMPIGVLDQTGSGSNLDVSNGILFAANHNAHVINLSLGGVSYSNTMQSAVTAAYNMGSLVIAAMGNDANTIAFYPAAYSNVMAVAATNRSDQRSYYSNFGAWCDISAPGGEMNSQAIDGIYSSLPTYPVYLNSFGLSLNYDYLQGTSMAAPHVAGLAALIWSLQPGLTPAQVTNIIQTTSKDLGASGKDGYYGWGRINAQAALQMTQQMITPVLSVIDNPASLDHYSLSWSNLPAVAGYLLQQAATPDFLSPVTRYLGPNHTINITGQPGGTWYYRVAPVLTFGIGPWSNTQTTTVAPDSLAAPVIYPINNINSDGDFTVSWQNILGAKTYSLEISQSPFFSDATEVYQGVLPQVDLVSQPINKWLFFRVRALSIAGNSAWSTVQAIHTGHQQFLGAIYK